MTKDKWRQLMNTLGYSENVEEYNIIIKSYNEKNRKYHNTTHILDCLDKCRLNEESKNNSILHLAFWYHDVIYNPLKKDNELKSAELAVKFLNNQKANKEVIQRIHNLIMVTLHNQNPKTIEEAFMMDIDISILGSDPVSYMNYSKNIRMEYKWVPRFIYKSKRIELLELFLRKEKLYFTNYFYEKLENNARQNIRVEIEQLKNA